MFCLVFSYASRCTCARWFYSRMIKVFFNKSLWHCLWRSFISSFIVISIQFAFVFDFIFSRICVHWLFYFKYKLLFWIFCWMKYFFLFFFFFVNFPIFNNTRSMISGANTFPVICNTGSSFRNVAVWIQHWGY